MKRYKQLSLEQRYTIECLLAQGYSQVQIAGVIGVHKSTISRELNRNVNRRGTHANMYDFSRAQSKTDNRHKSKRKCKRLDLWHLVYIREKLRKHRWSPEYISHRGKLEFGDFVSHETIYKYIWMCKKSGRSVHEEDKDLYKYLKHNKRRQKRSRYKGNKGCISNRVSIEKRPDVANDRGRLGDLEVDLMMGSNHKPALIVLTDRKTVETCLIKIETKKAKQIAKKIIGKMKKQKNSIQTLSFDNDMAFAEHEQIGCQLGAQTYFTRPYTSQDKGTVENRIGVIRRFFPKGTDMSKVHPNTIRSVESKLNNRPLRKFKYLTPLEMKRSLQEAR